MAANTLEFQTFDHFERSNGVLNIFVLTRWLPWKEMDGGVWFSERIENEASSNKERCFRYRERHKGTVTRPIITMSTEPGVAISGNGPADAAMQTLAFNVTFSSCERVAWLLVVTSVAATHTSWLPSSYLFFPLLRAFHRVSPQHRCPRFYDSIVISIGRFVGNWKKKKFFFFPPKFVMARDVVPLFRICWKCHAISDRYHHV